MMARPSIPTQSRTPSASLAAAAAHSHQKLTEKLRSSART